MMRSSLQRHHVALRIMKTAERIRRLSLERDCLWSRVDAVMHKRTSVPPLTVFVRAGDRESFTSSSPSGGSRELEQQISAMRTWLGCFE